ncbi:hypothetical protein OG542_39890 [Streptomyces violaceus]|uniref:hypothetical protein n=1 Tax=Streptomyces violaceus TaxID=1936 RepID=UPI002E24C47A
MARSRLSYPDCQSAPSTVHPARARKNSTIFKNPTSRIRVGQQENCVIQPLGPGHVQSAVTVVAWPADRLILALAAVHAARPSAIRRLSSTTSTSATADWSSTAVSDPWTS